MPPAKIQVEQINVNSPHLVYVKQLWRDHRATLGFFPDQAFDDYAHKGGIQVALASGHCIGYVLYSISKQRAKIVHLCVSSEHRKRGAAHALIDGVRERTREQRGMFLKCREDYDAHATWQRLNFANIGESNGRSKSGSTLIHWWMDYGKADLFDHRDGPESIDVAMDTNVFVDLMDDRHEESQGLVADWLRDSITLCYTHELLNDVGRSEDASIRQRRRSEVEQFKLLRSSPEQFITAEAILQPLFSDLPTERDESDFRHLVRALASEASVFVTRDDALLDHSDLVYDACGLMVMRPASLIGQIDTLQKEQEYQRRFVAGTKQICQTRLSELNDEFVEAMSHNNERNCQFKAQLNRYLANPNKYGLYSLRDAKGDMLAAYVTERDGNQICVPVLRVLGKRQSGTLSRYLLTGLIRLAVASKTEAIFVSDSEVTETISAACTELGFLPVEGGRVKLVISGLVTSADAAENLQWSGPSIDQLKIGLGDIDKSASMASSLEHVLWPAKLADALLPCYIVPIRPQYAEHLFDERLANGGLFGADVDLALNPQSAYYRAAKPTVLTCPSRILWYVSGKHTYTGTMSIRACSRLVELAIGTPKELYPQFRRLGVFEWADVLETADGDIDKQIMAFRFDDSELLKPIPWNQFQHILKSHGVRTQLQSPVEIPAKAFGEIYALAFDTSATR